MNKTQANLQDMFLNQVRKDNIGVTIYLVGGVQLKGFVKGFDAFTVVLESPGKPPQMVYKHAIASVVPNRAVGSLYAREEREEPREEEQPVEEQPMEEQPEGEQV